MFHPDDRQNVAQVLSDALAGIRPYDIEFRVIRPDGSTRHVHSRAEVARDQRGKPLRLFGSVADVTEAKARECEIERLNRLYAALSELHQTVVRVKSRGNCLMRSAGLRPNVRAFAWRGSANMIPLRMRSTP